MRHVIPGIIITIISVCIFIIAYAIFADPISLLSTTLSAAYPENFSSTDSTRQQINFAPIAFDAAIVFGVIAFLVFFLVWCLKYEYERS